MIGDQFPDGISGHKGLRLYFENFMDPLRNPGTNEGNFLGYLLLYWRVTGYLNDGIDKIPYPGGLTICNKKSLSSSFRVRLKCLSSQDECIHHVIDIGGIDEMLLVANAPHSA